MRRTIAAAVTGLGLLTTAVQPAHAADPTPETIGYNDGETGFTLARVSDVQTSVTPFGACSFSAVSDPTVEGLLGGEDAYTGEIDARILLYSEDPAANPVFATVTCELRVNSVAQDSASGSGAGVVVFADVLTYVAADDDLVELCTTVEVAAGTTSWCWEATDSPFPPQETGDLLYQVSSFPDPLICPVLASLSPGLPGVVEIDSEGDVTVAGGEPFWDCPPYDSFAAIPAQGPADAHDVVSGCSFKLSRHTGLVTVAGRTHAGRHPTAASASIRCRLVDATTGTVLYDQTRTEPGAQARIQEVVPIVASRITVCTAAQAWWNDGHNLTLPLTCQAG